ncbi:hypothetical protein NE865_11059 [Phthorimaea operculella]|nr:hypothetical protein NE865_11059 [Phthorimaea operculella]
MITYTIITLSSFCVVLAYLEGPVLFQKRYKRDAVGALDIVTNNGQAIHADVKQENLADNEVTTPATPVTDKLSSANGTEAGDVATPDLVTAPKDVAVVFGKSGRKSWPLSNQLDLVRSISRVVAFSVVIIAAAIEVYSLIGHFGTGSSY